MLSDITTAELPSNQGFVLILVLMEYALWLMLSNMTASIWVCLNPCSNGICSLTIYFMIHFPVCPVSLNPCSNGICSLTSITTAAHKIKNSLNPCSNGICSLTVVLTLSSDKNNCVLILVLMEYALWQEQEGCHYKVCKVLILVLMEYALWLQYYEKL